MNTPGLMTPGKRLASLLRTTLGLPDSIYHAKHQPEMQVRSVFPDGTVVAWTPLPEDEHATANGRAAALLAVEPPIGLPRALDTAMRELIAAADRSGFTFVVQPAVAGALPLDMYGFSATEDCFVREPKLATALA
jgi:hypothetical protein